MTLRNANEVIVALFFFALRSELAIHRRLEVPRLRAAEPTPRHSMLAAALRTIETFAERLGCHEAMIRAETSSAAWLETAAALLQVGPANGFERRGPDWVRVFDGQQQSF